VLKGRVQDREAYIKDLQKRNAKLEARLEYVTKECKKNVNLVTIAHDDGWNAALEAAAECCTAEKRNTNILLSNPPKSAAALNARDAIHALMRKEGNDE